jgi:sulfonate transport system substrate-binding protein
MNGTAAITRRSALALAAAAAWRPGFAAAPAELRIGFQKSMIGLALLKLQGMLDKRLTGTKVSWHEFPAGPQLLEALSVGSVDIGATGDSPPVFAQAAGKELLYVGAEPPKPLAAAILVKPDGPVKTLADLKGRRIGLQRGSSANYLTVRAVAKAGLQWRDIQAVYLPPADGRAAFERGAIDAWAIWDPYFAAGEIEGGTQVLPGSQGLTLNNTVYLASPRFAASQGAVLQQVFDALTEVDVWRREHRKEAAQAYAEFAGLGLAAVHRVLERRPPAPVRPLTPEIVAEQQRIADAFAQLQLIPKPIQVAQIVWQPGSNRVAQAR